MPPPMRGLGRRGIERRNFKFDVLLKATEFKKKHGHSSASTEQQVSLEYDVAFKWHLMILS